MPSPLPALRRGPGRRQKQLPRPLLLACPRISPKWELDALRALMKPQLKHSIEHRKSRQPWPTDATLRVQQVCRTLDERIGYSPEVHLPIHGDYFLVCSIHDSDQPAARALALMLSKAFADTWFVLGRLFVQNRIFYRRERRLRLNLVRATNIHLPRELRSALRGVI